MIASHTCTILSLPHAAINLPSGDQATPFIPAEVLPVNDEFLPVVESHTCMLLSLLTEAIRWPFGDHISPLTRPEWPL